MNPSPFTSSAPSHVFGDFAAEYEEWGQPQRAAAERLVNGALPHLLAAPTGAPTAALPRLLDAGAGTGFIRDALDHASILRATCLASLDASLPMLRYGARKPGFNPVAGDAAALPIRAGVLDHIFTSFTLHWLPEPALFFHEARRVLRPGGWLHAAVPVAGSLAEFRDAIAPIALAANYQLDIEVYPRAGDLSAHAAAAGFEDECSALTEFSYAPVSVRDMLAFMRYAGASRFVRPRHAGDFLRFAVRLARRGTPVPLIFRVLLLHARRDG